jgi:hypothetical protein
LQVIGVDGQLGAHTRHRTDRYKICDSNSIQRSSRIDQHTSSLGQGTALRIRAPQDDLLELGHVHDEPAALLSPRGPASEHGANRWFRRLAEGVFDTDDLLARTDQLAAFVTSAVEHYQLVTSRVVAVGFSNGPISPPPCCCDIPACCGSISDGDARPGRLWAVCGQVTRGGIAPR